MAPFLNREGAFFWPLGWLECSCSNPTIRAIDAFVQWWNKAVPCFL